MTVKKPRYLVPHQKTSEMINELFRSILADANQRPVASSHADSYQTLYQEVKTVLREQDGIFMVASVLAALEERKVKHTHKEVMETLHILEDVGKLRKMGEVQVGDVSHNLYLYGYK